ncbi:hypothetical protein BV25DRAFT_1830418 [Artomyces pyxidatus]|uniref:Uncharacterized protein n=1 Tax=Artomyces pyxidatus TaxID=48021 RepID=A0ACB8SPD7_9AGAM|nr:hypothetical protein BV25DRAFT_1830418 [Artomyces pyxidatus]
MRTSSWYEPEKDRIVITDLDASSDEEDVAPPLVLPAFLRHPPLAAPLPRLRAESDPGMALVVFRPLGMPGTLEPPPEPEPPAAERAQGSPDADAMDVEP